MGLPESARKHFDAWDMIGMYVPKGKLDSNKDLLKADWVDGGDSCHFVGIFHYLYRAYPELKSRQEFAGNMGIRLAQAYHLLSVKSKYGGFKRHPDTRYWYGANNVMSRDQLTPMLCALAVSQNKVYLRWQLLSHVRRALLFTTNTRKNGSSATNHGQKFKSAAKPLRWYHKLVLKYKIPLIPVPDGYRNYNWKLPDITLFDIWGIYIRGLQFKVLYPLLYAADIQTLINGILLLKRPDDMDVANFFLKHSLSRKLMPTIISAITQRYILPKLNLSARVAFNYYRPGMPQFLGNTIRAGIQIQNKEKL